MRVKIIDKTDVNDPTNREGVRKSCGLQEEYTTGNSITPSKLSPLPVDSASLCVGEGMKCYYQLYYILNINKYTMVVF